MMKHLRKLVGYFLAPVVPAFVVFTVISGMPTVRGGIFFDLYIVAFVGMAALAIPVLIIFFRKFRARDFLYSGLFAGFVASLAIAMTQRYTASGIGMLEVLICAGVLLGSVAAGFLCGLSATGPSNAIETDS